MTYPDATPEQEEQIIKLWKTGDSYGAISLALRMPSAVVRRVLKKHSLARTVVEARKVKTTASIMARTELGKWKNKR